MSLLRNYEDWGAQKVYDFTSGVIIGLGNSIFSSLAAMVTALTTLNTALGTSILPFNQSTKATRNTTTANKLLVIKKLNEVRPAVEEICLDDESKEILSGFTPNKRTRSRRTSIAATHIESISSSSVPGELLIKLSETVHGNTGFEAHYVLDGKDYVAGTFNVRNRSLLIVASGFPSSKAVSVYLITLSTNGTRSTPSNYVTATAS